MSKTNGQTHSLEISYPEIDALKTAFEEVPLKGDSLTAASWNIVRLAPYGEQRATEKRKESSRIMGKAGNGPRQISRTDPKYPEIFEAMADIDEKKVKVNGLLPLHKTDLKIPSDEPPVGLQRWLAILLRHGLIIDMPDPVQNDKAPS